jgi:hypothetical protein
MLVNFFILVFLLENGLHSLVINNSISNAKDYLQFHFSPWIQYILQNLKTAHSNILAILAFNSTFLNIYLGLQNFLSQYL